MADLNLYTQPIGANVSQIFSQQTPAQVIAQGKGPVRIDTTPAPIKKSYKSYMQPISMTDVGNMPSILDTGTKSQNLFGYDPTKALIGGGYKYPTPVDAKTSVPEAKPAWMNELQYANMRVTKDPIKYHEVIKQKIYTPTTGLTDYYMPSKFSADLTKTPTTLYKYDLPQSDIQKKYGIFPKSFSPTEIFTGMPGTYGYVTGSPISREEYYKKLNKNINVGAMSAASKETEYNKYFSQFIGVGERPVTPPKKLYVEGTQFETPIGTMGLPTLSNLARNTANALQFYVPVGQTMGGERVMPEDIYKKNLALEGTSILQPIAGTVKSGMEYLGIYPLAGGLREYEWVDGKRVPVQRSMAKEEWQRTKDVTAKFLKNLGGGEDYKIPVVGATLQLVKEQDTLAKKQYQYDKESAKLEEDASIAGLKLQKALNEGGDVALAKVNSFNTRYVDTEAQRIAHEKTFNLEVKPRKEVYETYLAEHGKKQADGVYLMDTPEDQAVALELRARYDAAAKPFNEEANTLNKLYDEGQQLKKDTDPIMNQITSLQKTVNDKTQKLIDFEQSRGTTLQQVGRVAPGVREGDTGIFGTGISPEKASVLFGRAATQAGITAAQTAMLSYLPLNPYQAAGVIPETDIGVFAGIGRASNVALAGLQKGFNIGPKALQIGTNIIGAGVSYGLPILGGLGRSKEYGTEAAGMGRYIKEGDKYVWEGGLATIMPNWAKSIYGDPDALIAAGDIAGATKARQKYDKLGGKVFGFGAGFTETAIATDIATKGQSALLKGKELQLTPELENVKGVRGIDQYTSGVLKYSPPIGQKGMSILDTELGLATGKSWIPGQTGKVLYFDWAPWSENVATKTLLASSSPVKAFGLGGSAFKGATIVAPMGTSELPPIYQKILTTPGLTIVNPKDAPVLAESLKDMVIARSKGGLKSPTPLSEQVIKPTSSRVIAQSPTEMQTQMIDKFAKLAKETTGLRGIKNAFFGIGPFRSGGSLGLEAAGYLKGSAIRAKSGLGDFDWEFYSGGPDAAEKLFTELRPTALKYGFDLKYNAYTGEIDLLNPAGDNLGHMINILAPDTPGAALPFTPFGTIQKTSQIVKLDIGGGKTVNVLTKAPVDIMADKLQAMMGGISTTNEGTTFTSTREGFKSAADYISGLSNLNIPTTSGYSAAVSARFPGSNIAAGINPTSSIPIPINTLTGLGTLWSGEAGISSSKVPTIKGLSGSLLTMGEVPVSMIPPSPYTFTPAYSGSSLSSSSKSMPSLISKGLEDETSSWTAKPPSLSELSRSVESSLSPSSLSYSPSSLSSLSASSSSSSSGGSSVSSSGSDESSKSGSSRSSSSSSTSSSSSSTTNIGGGFSFPPLAPFPGFPGGGSEGRRPGTRVGGVNVNFLRNFFFEKVQQESPLKHKNIMFSELPQSLKVIKSTPVKKDMFSKSYNMKIASNSAPFIKKMPLKVKEKKKGKELGIIKHQWDIDKGIGRMMS